MRLVVLAAVLLAGCGGAPAYDMATDPSLPGVTLYGRLSVEDGHWVADGWATTARAGYEVPGLCATPFDHSTIEDAEGQRVTREDDLALRCQGIRLEPWPPGKRLPYEFTWDGRDHREDTTVDPQSVVWVIRFDAAFDEERGGRVSLELRFT